MGFGVDLMAFSALVTETLPPAQTSLAANDARRLRARVSDRPPGQSPGQPRRAPHVSARKPYPRIGAKRAQCLDAQFLGTKCLVAKRLCHLLDRTDPTQAAAPAAPACASPEPLVGACRDSRRPACALHLAACDRRVVKAEGPERIAPEWWRSLVRRDRSANFITSILAGEVERSSIGREGGELQAQSLSLTPLPPQGGRG